MCGSSHTGLGGSHKQRTQVGERSSDRSLFFVPTMDSTTLQRELRELLEPTVSGQGYDLVGVEWLGGPTGPILRVSIEAPGGVDADDCAAVAATLSPFLDAEDPIAGAYNLEVSSPGIDRPVQRREDFERFAGFRVRIRLVEGPPRRRYLGTLGPLVGDQISVSVDGTEHLLNLDMIERAHLVLDLDEYRELAGGTA